MQGHNHSGRGHVLGMLGIGAVVLLGLMATGRSFGQALPLALVLACPLMMFGMMSKMHNGQEHQQDENNPNAHEAHTHETGHTRPAALEQPTFSPDVRH